MLANKLDQADKAMDYLTFIATMTGSLAWPIAAIVIAAIFQTQIKGLLNKVRKLSWGDKAVDFAEKLDEVEATATTIIDSAAPNVPIGASAQPEPVGRPNTETITTTNTVPMRGDDDRFEKLVILAPAAAILESWHQLEEKIEALLKSFNISGEKNKRRSLADLLRDHGLINIQGYVILEELRKLRNAAAHNQPVTATDAYRFRKLSQDVSILMAVDQ